MALAVKKSRCNRHQLAHIVTDNGGKATKSPAWFRGRASQHTAWATIEIYYEIFIVEIL